MPASVSRKRSPREFLSLRNLDRELGRCCLLLRVLCAKIRTPHRDIYLLSLVLQPYAAVTDRAHEHSQALRTGYHGQHFALLERTAIDRGKSRIAKENAGYI